MVKLKYLNNKLSSGGILVVALMATNFFNFLLNAILGRVLTLEQFSYFTFANTLWFVIIILLNSIASTTNNRTAYLLGKRGIKIAAGFRSFVTRKSIHISIALTTIWILGIPFLSKIFQTNDEFIFIALAPSISLGVLTAVNRGFFQGIFSFAKAAVIIISESFSKLLIIILMILFGFSEFAYLAIPFSIAIAFIVSRYFSKTSKTNVIKKYNYIFPKKLFLATFLIGFSSTAFLSIDLLLARYYMIPAESGAYSLLSLIGKMVYFFGGILNVFILTLASRDTGQNKNSAINFYKIIIIEAFLLLISVICLGFFGKFFVPLLFGAKSLSIIPYLTTYTLGISFFTMATAFATYHLAKQQFVFVLSGLASVIIVILGVILSHENIYNFVQIILVSGYIMLSLNILLHIFNKDISMYIDEEDIKSFSDNKYKKNSLNVSICIPAYNEEKNIRYLLERLLNQKTYIVNVKKIVVVSSGSTDKTNQIVSRLAKKYKKIKFIKESQRKGKASAISTFLKLAKEPVVVIQSADTLPFEDTIENLCRPFIADKSIGMTGGAPIPLNNPNTFIGNLVHAWWWFHRRIPRFGEIIAFRNIINTIPEDILCDEAYFQIKFSQLGLKRVHIDEAKVHNKGPESIRELVEQRRKLFIGHAVLYKSEGIRISNMTKSSIYLILFKYRMFSFRQLIWLVGGIVIESYSRILALYDTHVKRSNPYVWDIAKSTKDLNAGTKGGESLK